MQYNTVSNSRIFTYHLRDVSEHNARDNRENIVFPRKYIYYVWHLKYLLKYMILVTLS